MTYTVDFTDKRKTPITIDDADIDNSTDVTLFGRTRLAYGEALQENLLHILENFSCPEDPNINGNPDLSVAAANSLSSPTEGQFWYNSTQDVLNFYDGVNWIPLARQDSIAANWGIISDGQYLPTPISEVDGRVFDIGDCVWTVSPMNIPQKIDYLVCNTDNLGLVNSKYRLKGTDVLLSGVANYLIVGIKGNVNQPAPPINITPTPTVTPTSSIAQSVTPTPSVSPTTTPPVTPTRTQTPLPSSSTTPTPQVSPSPHPSNTPAPSITPTPSPVPSTLGFNGQTYRRACGIPTNMASGNAGITIAFGTGQWVITYNCHGTTTTIDSGPIPSNAYLVNGSATYRPDLDGTGFSVNAGTVGSNLNLPVSNNTAFIGVSCSSVRGNSGNTAATCYSINIVMTDINGYQINNSTCVFDVGATGTA